MKVENVKVYNIIDALRGMRNPLNSWNKNDSTTKCNDIDGHVTELKIGPNDMRLVKTLIHGGQPHRKFLRQISVSMDIIAPTYWWAEMDTYKIATTRNSCSVQHKGSSRDFVISDFTIDGVYDYGSTKLSESEKKMAIEDMNSIIGIVNRWRKLYVEGNKEKYDYFRIMRQLLPMGYNYKATFTCNYETLLNIYEWRHNHLLKEWHEFCDYIIKECPGFNEMYVNISDT